MPADRLLRASVLLTYPLGELGWRRAAYWRALAEYLTGPRDPGSEGDRAALGTVERAKRRIHDAG